jgi:hypothetical protein
VNGLLYLRSSGFDMDGSVLYHPQGPQWRQAVTKVRAF